jgi:hypothetical protein
MRQRGEGSWETVHGVSFDTSPSMPRLFFETDSAEPLPCDFGGPSDVLVYFLSLVFATRYGSQHELSQLALQLRGAHKINLDPLAKFADRDVEEPADERELERAWQDAAPLAETLARVVAALESPDDRARELTAGTPDLLDRLRDLHRMAAWAAERGARVRMSFEL